MSCLHVQVEAIEPHEGRPKGGETCVGCYMRVQPERADVSFLGNVPDASRCIPEMGRQGLQIPLGTWNLIGAELRVRTLWPD